MKKLLKKLLKDEQGYGTVELLIIIAAMGVLATALMKGLQASMVGTESEPGAVNNVGKSINSLVEQWDTNPNK